MEENFLVYVDWLPVEHVATRFSVKKNFTNKKIIPKKGRKEGRKQETKKPG